MSRHHDVAHPIILAVAALAVGVTAWASHTSGSAGATAPGLPAAMQATPLPKGSEPVTLDPADFTTRIDNPYWPMAPGDRWVYRETRRRGAPQRIVITVTNQTKVVAAGVRARVLHDVVTRNGRPVEDTFDWVAQDRRGNIWYLGEDSRDFRNGQMVTSPGSWEAGADGAQAGILVPATPRPGLEYRQEYRPGRAEDAARVLSLDEQVDVPFGHFSRLLMTKEFTPLEPRALEYKFYARKVGLVMALDVSGGSSREELISFKRGGR
jgi:hypothetical protein